MKTKLAISCVVASLTLIPMTSFSAENGDSDRSHPAAFVKDSAITAKIKAKLAAQ